MADQGGGFERMRELGRLGFECKWEIRVMRMGGGLVV